MRRWAPILVCLGVALLVRVSVVGQEGFWIDEASTIRVSRGAPLQILERIASFNETHPPLYYFLLSGWMSWFGEGEVAIRSLSVLFGVLAIPFVCLLAREVGAGMWGAGLVAALSPVLVLYSQEARMYALLVLTALAATWSWLAAPSGRVVQVVLAISTAAMLAAHHVGLFYGAVLGGLSLVWPQAGRDRLCRVTPLLVGLGVYLPLLYSAMQQWGKVQGYFTWNQTGSLPVRLARVVPFVVMGDLPGGFLMSRVLQVVTVGLALVGLVSLLRESKRDRLLMLMAATVGVVGLVGLFSALTQPFFQRRYFVFLGGPAAILVASAVAAPGGGTAARRVARFALGLITALVLVAGIGLRASVPRHVDVRGVVEALAPRLATLSPEGPPVLLHFAPRSTPQDGFLVSRQYRPDWQHCLVLWEGHAYSPEAAAFVGDACEYPSLAAALEGRSGTVPLMVTGLGLSASSGPLLPSQATTLADLKESLPEGWRIGRTHQYHLVWLVELEGPEGDRP